MIRMGWSENGMGGGAENGMVSEWVMIRMGRRENGMGD